MGVKCDMTERYDGGPKLSTLFAVERPIGRDKGNTHVVGGPIRFTDLCEYHVLPSAVAPGSGIWRPRG